MDRNTFLNCLIDDGIYEITITYTRPDQKIKKEGGIAGFEACRAKEDEEILELYQERQSLTQHARLSEQPDYWGIRMFELQVEWVLNVLSAALVNQGLTPLITPTVRGMTKAADILGVKP